MLMTKYLTYLVVAIFVGVLFTQVAYAVSDTDASKGRPVSTGTGKPTPKPTKAPISKPGKGNQTVEVSLADWVR